MKSGEDSGEDLPSEASLTDDGHSLPHATVTEIPEKTAHRQRERRQSGAHLSIEGLPLADPGHYDIREEVARGGLGRIVAAFDNRLSREVALKELVVRHPVSEARFRREAKLTASLQHPAIIPVHDAGVWKDGQPFYAMKLVDGQSLASAISTTRTYEQRIAMLPHVVDVAEAMAYAHSQRIIHRDLKPANILVGAFGETVVIDWGLAKDLDRSRIADDLLVETSEKPSGYNTSEGAVLGTPAYMPPEQANGEKVDERADVYALGALLYHLLAGKRPFFDVPASELLEVVGEQRPDPLMELVPEAPADLVAIVDKAMALEPEQRYANAGELADELGRFTTGQLVGAYKYSSQELMVRFLRRHRRVLVTVGVSLSILLAYGVWSLVRITSERNRAEDAVAIQRQLRQEAEVAAEREVVLRSDAQARNRSLIVSQARFYLASDPTAAIATLKQLDESVPGAASIVAEAQELGVARHVLRNPERDQIRAVDVAAGIVAWSDDGGHVAVAKGANIELLDLHDGKRVPALQLTRDGQHLVTGGYDRQVLVTHVESRKSRALGKTPGRVLDVAVSPDGASVAAICSSGQITIWPIAGGTPQTWTTAVGRSAFVRFAPNGLHLATGSHQNTVLLIDLTTDRSTYLSGHNKQINDAQFTPDSTHLATASADGKVRIWTVTGDPVRVLNGHNSAIQALAFSPSGDLLASGDMSGQVRVAPWRSGGTRLLGQHEERVTDIAFALGSSVVVSASWDKTARMFSVAGGGTRELRGHRDVITSMAVSDDGATLVTGSWDTHARVWNLTTPGRKVLSGHTVGVKTVAFSPDGSFVASGGHDDTVRLWGVESGRSRVYRKHTDHVYRVAFSPDGTWLASTSDDQTARLWDVAGNRDQVLKGHRADVEELAWAGDGSFLVTAAEDRTARVWPVNADGPPRTLGGHGGAVTDVEVLADNRSVVTASADGKLRLWTDGLEAIKVAAAHQGPVWQVSRLGRSLVSVGDDDTVKLWNESLDAPVVVADNIAGARALDTSERAGLIAVGGVRGAVWICKAEKDANCSELRGHVGTVLQVQFSPNGTLVASAGADNSVRIWEVESGEHRVLYGHRAPVFDVAFSADGSQLASGSGDSTVRLWSVQAPPKDLSAALGQLTSYEMRDAP